MDGVAEAKQISGKIRAVLAGDASISATRRFDSGTAMFKRAGTTESSQTTTNCNTIALDRPVTLAHIDASRTAQTISFPPPEQIST